MRARLIAEPRVRLPDVGERLGDLKAAADREVDAERREREGDGVLEALENEHRERERVLGARFLPARAAAPKRRDGFGVALDRFVHANRATQEHVARAASTSALARRRNVASGDDLERAIARGERALHVAELAEELALDRLRLDLELRGLGRAGHRLGALARSEGRAPRSPRRDRAARFARARGPPSAP